MASAPVVVHTRTQLKSQGGKGKPQRMTVGPVIKLNPEASLESTVRKIGKGFGIDDAFEGGVRYRLQWPSQGLVLSDEHKWRMGVVRWEQARSKNTQVVKQFKRCLEGLSSVTEEEKLNAIDCVWTLCSRALNCPAAPPKLLEMMAKVVDKGCTKASGQGELKILAEVLGALWMMAAGRNDVGDHSARMKCRKQLVNQHKLPGRLTMLVGQLMKQYHDKKRHEKAAGGWDMGLVGLKKGAKKSEQSEKEAIEKAKKASMAKKELREKATHELMVEVLGCSELMKVDTLSEDDPYCIIYWNDGQNDIEIGRTSVIQNSDNPVWKDETFIVPLPVSAGNLSASELRVEVRASARLSPAPSLSPAITNPPWCITHDYPGVSRPPCSLPGIR
jgi:hypothetical protein